MATLNITLDQVISYAISQKVSEVTYYCPANNYSCYYQFDDQSIHINLNSIEHTYETLGSDHDTWLDDLDECQVYSILHELGHHLQPQYFRLKDQRYQAEVDAWDRAESILNSLNKEVPDNFYVYRDFQLDTYSDYKHGEQNAPTSIIERVLLASQEKAKLRQPLWDALSKEKQFQNDCRINLIKLMFKNRKGYEVHEAHYKLLIQHSEEREQKLRDKLDLI